MLSLIMIGGGQCLYLSTIKHKQFLVNFTQQHCCAFRKDLIPKKDAITTERRHSAHRVRLKTRSSWVRIPPGGKFLGSYVYLHCNAAVHM
jgi:hypothetical protein